MKALPRLLWSFPGLRLLLDWTEHARGPPEDDQELRVFIQKLKDLHADPDHLPGDVDIEICQSAAWACEWVTCGDL